MAFAAHLPLAAPVRAAGGAGGRRGACGDPCQASFHALPTSSSERGGNGAGAAGAVAGGPVPPVGPAPLYPSASSTQSILWAGSGCSGGPVVALAEAAPHVRGTTRRWSAGRATPLFPAREPSCCSPTSKRGISWWGRLQYVAGVGGRRGARGGGRSSTGGRSVGDGGVGRRCGLLIRCGVSPSPSLLPPPLLFFPRPLSSGQPPRGATQPSPSPLLARRHRPFATPPRSPCARRWCPCTEVPDSCW